MTEDVVESVVALLLARGWRLATAESCTGGLIAHWMTSLPGSSATYVGGVVAYANTIKTAILGVPASLIEQAGAVSAPVAEAMAAGARERLDADVAISTTGIAGPSGATPDKPVGLVFIGVALRSGYCTVKSFQFKGTRTEIQIAAGKTALKMVQEKLIEISTVD